MAIRVPLQKPILADIRPYWNMDVDDSCLPCTAPHSPLQRSLASQSFADSAGHENSAKAGWDWGQSSYVPLAGMGALPSLKECEIWAPILKLAQNGVIVGF